MKITCKTAAQSLLLLAACLAAVAQSKPATDHFRDGASVGIAVRQEAQVRSLQSQLEDYEKLLREKREEVENARQEAISAGILGDGAGPLIDFSREQQMELEALQTALNPKIEQARKLIAGLKKPVSPGPSSLNRKRPLPIASRSKCRSL